MKVYKLFPTLLVGAIFMLAGNAKCSKQYADLSQIEAFEKQKITNLKIPQEPKAIAHVDGERGILLTPKHKLLLIDAQSSYDPDGDDQKLKYTWTNLNGYLLSQDKNFITKFDHKGFEEITLRVKDEQNLTSIDRICVLVEINESEIPLVVRVDGKNEVKAQEQTYLVGRAPCKRDIVSYEWKEDGITLSKKAILSVKFPQGDHNLSLTIKDIEGNKATDYVMVKAI